MILGHTSSGDLVESAGSPPPTDEERALYWADVRDREAKDIRDGVKVRDPSYPYSYPVGYASREEVQAHFFASLQFVGSESVDLLHPEVPILDTNALARALFETDPDVVAFVHKHAEVCGWDGRGTWEDFDAARAERTAQTFAVAWVRDELGARTKWTERAEAVVRAMKGGGT